MCIFTRVSHPGEGSRLFLTRRNTRGVWDNDVLSYLVTHGVWLADRFKCWVYLHYWHSAGCPKFALPLELNTDQQDAPNASQVSTGHSTRVKCCTSGIIYTLTSSVLCAYSLHTSCPLLGGTRSLPLPIPTRYSYQSCEIPEMIISYLIKSRVPMMIN